MILIPPGTPHYDYSDEPYEQMAMMVNDEMLTTSKKYVQFDDDGTFEHMALVIFDVFWGKGENREEILSSLWDAWRRLFYEKTNAARTCNREAEKVRNAMLHRFTDPDFGVSDAVSGIGYSEAHFRKLFRESFGVSMSEYLLELRIDCAKNLLGNGDNTVAFAAELSGFSDVRYFSRMFKKYTGMTPREYKKEKQRGREK